MISDQFEKLPPHDLEAEKCLLGSMLLLGGDVASFAEISGILDREAFYQGDHQVIFDSIVQLQTTRQAIDAVTVRDSLNRRGLFEEIGGNSTLAGLLEKVPSAAHYAHYARIVAGKGKWRSLISLANAALREAYGAHGGETELEAADAALSSLASKASQACISGKSAKIHHVSEVIPEILAMRERGDVQRFHTGLTELDKLTGGLGYGLKHLIGALPYMGKSALIKALAMRLAARGMPVGIISIEEDRQKITANMLSGQSGVANNRIQFATANQSEWELIAEAATGLAELPIHLVDSARKLSAVVGMAQLLVAKHGCRAIFVDHIHIIEGSESGLNREGEIRKISADLKWLWRSLNVIGVEACQLNRSVGRDRPEMRHLRDSGTLEADADVVMLLYREDYHNKDNPDYKKTNMLEVIVAKNKAGAAGTIPLWYDEARYMICDQCNGRPVFDSGLPQIDHDMVDGAFA